MLPGVAVTGARVEVPLVAVARFRDGRVPHEHIHQRAKGQRADVTKLVALRR